MEARIRPVRQDASPRADVGASPSAEVVAAADGADTTVVADAGEEIVAVEGELPSTGGASVLALGTGVLLVAGGLVARRIVR